MSLYGQEKELETWAIVQINLFLHDINDAFIARGDTLLDPKRYDPSAGEFLPGVGAYDPVLANPPFSVKEWGHEVWTNGDQAIARTNRTCSITPQNGTAVDKPHGRIVDYIGVPQNLEDALSSYCADDVQNALTDLDLLRRDLRKTHADFTRLKRLMGLNGMDEKAATYSVEKLVSDGREDDWFELQRLGRNFVQTYGDLSPDPAILEFTEDTEWAATFLRLAQQAITKDESLDHLNYSSALAHVVERSFCR